MYGRSLATTLVLGLLATACTNFTPPTQVKKIDPTNQAYWFRYAAERRGATSVPQREDGSSGIMICAEPAPDVALQHTNSVLAKVNLPETADAELKADFASQVIQLAGRTQTVLLLREAMYRLCEQSLNGNISESDVTTLFGKVLETTVLMGKADALNSGARLQPDPQGREEIMNFINGVE